MSGSKSGEYDDDNEEGNGSNESSEKTQTRRRKLSVSLEDSPSFPESSFASTRVGCPKPFTRLSGMSY